MSYIGTPPSNAFTSLLKQDFSTSATTGYTLDHAVNNANDIALFINFVRQEPTAGYAASGTTLTLTSATASSDDMYCVYLGQALQTVNPPNVSVGTAQLIDGAVTSAKLASGAVANTPAFLAYNSSNQTGLGDITWVKYTPSSEVFDTDGAYDSSTNYRFQPQTAGKYFIYAGLICEAGTVNQLTNARVGIFKNGGDYFRSQFDFRNQNAYQATPYLGVPIVLNGSSDYVEIFARLDVTTGTGVISGGTQVASYFGAYKIIE